MTSWTTTGTRTTDAPWTLLYRRNSDGNAGDLAWPFSAGLDTRWRLDETINGTKAGPGRL